MGKLIYLSHITPDIVYAVSVVSQFMYNPFKFHLEAVYCLIHYLKGTSSMGILFQNVKEISLEAYTYENQAGSIVDRRSTTGYCIVVVETWLHREVKSNGL